MFDIGAGQDRNRPLGREVARQQRLADLARLSQRLRVGHRAPAPGYIALREQDAVGRNLGPMHQPFGDLVRIGPERLRRAQQQTAVGARLNHHVLRSERDLAQRRQGCRDGACGLCVHSAIAITLAGSGEA